MATTDNDYSPFIKESLNPTYRGMNFINYSDKGFEMYISFQTLLRFISENLNVISDGEGIVSIDWESDKPFYALSCHISTDLTKCYLYNEQLGIEDGANPESGFSTFHPFTRFDDSKLSEINTTLKNDAQLPADQTKYFAYPQIGNINFIYLNTGYLSQMIADNLDKENKITLRNFLQTICNDINRALGGINDFQVVIDPDQTPNVLTIIDVNQNRIKGLAKIYGNSQSYTLIQAQGIGPDNNTQGSFVTSLKAQSQITPEIASAISIGAQANGNQLGEEATSFSRLSKGLTDRVYPDKTIIKSISLELPIIDRFSENLKAFQLLVDNLRKDPKSTGAKLLLESSDVNNNGPIITDLFKAIVGEFTIKNQSNPTFIPIKLDIELLGISGIKIFQQFELSSDVLPLSYQNDFNFLITGITHEVRTHKWITKLATLTYLKEKDLTTAQKADIKPIKVLDLNFASTSAGATILGKNALDAYDRAEKAEPGFKAKVKQVAAAIKANELDLVKVMYKESGINSNIVNNEGAVGLIQFFPDSEVINGRLVKKTTKTIGGKTYSLNKLSQMNRIQQMDVVQEYFKTSGPYKEVADLYLYTFYPVAQGKPDSFILGSENKNNNYKFTVATSNPGITKYSKTFVEGKKVIDVKAFRVYVSSEVIK